MKDFTFKAIDGTVFVVKGHMVTITRHDQPEITLPVEILLTFVNYHLYP